MKSKKLIPVFAVLTAVCIFILTAFGACSSGVSSSEGSGTTPPDIPGGGEFVNPGDNLGGGGTYSLYGGETELTTFTVSSIITSVGSNGGMGGQGGPGGQGGQPGRPGGNR